MTTSILIAEDDPVSRRVLEATLAKWGYGHVPEREEQQAAQGDSLAGPHPRYQHEEREREGRLAGSQQPALDPKEGLEPQVVEGAPRRVDHDLALELDSYRGAIEQHEREAHEIHGGEYQARRHASIHPVEPSSAPCPDSGLEHQTRNEHYWEQAPPHRRP